MNPLYVGIDVSSRNNVIFLMKPDGSRIKNFSVLYMNEHFRENIDAAAIATAAGFSPNYLSRKFRLETGVGVHAYLTTVRLKNAALELVSTDYSITEIAIHCGFSDGNYFKDVFKKQYSQTPRQYREEARRPPS